MLFSESNQTKVQGFVREGYEAVREAFAENFSKRHELGAGWLCI